MLLLSLALAVLLCAPASALAQAEPVPPPARPDTPPATFVPLPAGMAGTALQLFAAAEAAWTVSDGERLASLVDTTHVLIGLKPDAPPATAATRVAAAFLFADQMRLVKTREFRVVRIDAPEKGPARATAHWIGDWGGRQGVRRIHVELRGVPTSGGWLLTEVRARR